MANHTQVAVIGGGLVGKATAVAAANAGFSTLHVAPDAPVDRRTSALMGPSVDYMIDAGLIDDPETLGTPLTRIRIIDATGRLLRRPYSVRRNSGTGPLDGILPMPGSGRVFRRRQRGMKTSTAEPRRSNRQVGSMGCGISNLAMAAH